jgi:CheY-like chemotaxis protein
MWDQVDNLQVILVVEGDHLIQSIVEESLTDGGFEIVIASSGQNALELLDARPKENIERSSPTSI